MQLTPRTFLLSSRDLTPLAKAGVLWLNTCLTVRAHKANSHSKKGWESFTDAVLNAVLQRANATGHGVVFFVWGLPAQKTCERLRIDEVRCLSCVYEWDGCSWKSVPLRPVRGNTWCWSTPFFSSLVSDLYGSSSDLRIRPPSLRIVVSSETGTSNGQTSGYERITGTRLIGQYSTPRVTRHSLVDNHTIQSSSHTSCGILGGTLYVWNELSKRFLQSLHDFFSSFESESTANVTSWWWTLENTMYNQPHVQ